MGGGGRGTAERWVPRLVPKDQPAKLSSSLRQTRQCLLRAYIGLRDGTLMLYDNHDFVAILFVCCGSLTCDQLFRALF